MSEERSAIFREMDDTETRVKITVPPPEYGGGYLIPEYTTRLLPGLRARFWRSLGLRFNRQDWYNRGVETVPFAARIREALR